MTVTSPAINRKFRRKAWLRLLVTLPAIWLAAYVVSKFKQYLYAAHGVRLHPLVYELVLVAAVSLVIALTFGDVLRDLRKMARESKERAD